MDAEDRREPEGAGAPSPAPPPPAEPVPIVRAAALLYGLLLGVALIWARVAGEPLLFLSAAAEARGVRLGSDFGYGLAAGLLVIGLSELSTRRTRVGERLAVALAGVLGRRSPLECVVLALTSGVAEEAFFRGALQPQIGLVAASILFGVVHFVPRRELLPWTGFAVAAGFLLGWLFDITGNLVAPIVAHVTINAVNLWLLTSRYAR